MGGRTQVWDFLSACTCETPERWAWHCAGTEDADKQALLQQLAKLDADYQGGLAQYIANARTLLADSKQGAACSCACTCTLTSERCAPGWAVHAHDCHRSSRAGLTPTACRRQERL